ncbi:restriction endonuclease subunit S [Bacillus paramycoides]|uniref:restriction endonuclease subunit S n=1 Tax=Bacillus paramycoides TaxID=2026194 RepID=UPI003D022C64
MKVNYKKIKEFAVIHSGTTPSTSNPEFWNGDIKWLTPAEMKDGHNWYINDSQRKITNEAVKNKKLKILKPGTVLLTSRAPIGKVGLVEAPMGTNQGFKNIECDTDIMNPEYLYFWLLGKKEYLNSLGRGATFKEISKKIVEEISVPVPELKVQNQIVKVLKQALELIEKRKSQITLLSLLTQSIFLDMFGDPYLNNKKWDVFSLGEICEIYNGSTPKSSIPEYWSGDIVWLTPSDLEPEDNYFIFESERKISQVGFEKTNLTLLPKGTVLLTSRAPIGKVAIAGRELCTNQGFKNLVCKEKVNNVYLYQYLLFHNQTLNNLGRGATFKEISKSVVAKIKIPVPPVELQMQYSNTVNKVEEQKELVKKSLTHLENNFNSIMQRAFKGKLFND